MPRRFDPPTAAQIGIVVADDISKCCLQRMGHALGGAVRDSEFPGDLGQAHAAAPCGGNLRQAQKVLRLGQGHGVPMTGFVMC